MAKNEAVQSVNKDVIAQGIKSLTDVVSSLMAVSRVKERELVVLTVTKASPVDIEKAKIDARNARASLRKAKYELALLREASAS